MTTVPRKYSLFLLRAIFLTDLDHHDVSKHPKDKFFEKVINPYLAEVLQHPQTIEMREGVLHIRDVEGTKTAGSMETRL